jgi:hypothetical protein
MGDSTHIEKILIRSGKSNYDASRVNHENQQGFGLVTLKRKNSTSKKARIFGIFLRFP